MPGITLGGRLHVFESAYESDGDPNLCTIRKYSVYTLYDFAYEWVYESVNDWVHLSKGKAKMTLLGIGMQKLNRVQFGAF
jgi:hypothetical protein